MKYLTYSEYEELGGVLDSTAFLRHIDRANCEIDNATHGRIEAMENIPSLAKSLCRDLVEYFAENNPTKRAVASESESAGVISESVSYMAKTSADMESEVQRLITAYLENVYDDNGTPLLYRGCMY